jgi:hypothetical protein
MPSPPITLHRPGIPPRLTPRPVPSRGASQRSGRLALLVQLRTGLATHAEPSARSVLFSSAHARMPGATEVVSPGASQTCETWTSTDTDSPSWSPVGLSMSRTERQRTRGTVRAAPASQSSCATRPDPSAERHPRRHHGRARPGRCSRPCPAHPDDAAGAQYGVSGVTARDLRLLARHGAGARRGVGS